MSAHRPRASAAVVVEDVTRRYGDKLALDRVSLTVEPGTILALLGPNGAGKSTMLRLLSGLTAPTSGTVRIDDEDPARQTRRTRAHIGLLPSGDRSLYLRISGLENLVFFARMHGFRRREAVKLVWQALEEVGLTEAAKQPAGTYSHGMQKRLAIARAVLGDPKVLLIDEATHDLDPENALRVRELIAARARAGAAVIWTTQRIEEVRGFADTVTLLRRGRVRFTGSVPALMAHARSRRYVVRLSGMDGAVLDGRLEAYGSLERADDAPDHYGLWLKDEAVLGDALAVLTAAGVKVHACREERPEIEEAFLSLTGDGSGEVP